MWELSRINGSWRCSPTKLLHVGEPLNLVIWTSLSFTAVDLETAAPFVIDAPLALLFYISKRINSTQITWACIMQRTVIPLQLKVMRVLAFLQTFWIFLIHSARGQIWAITLWVQCGSHQCSNLGWAIFRLFGWFGAESQDVWQSKRTFMVPIELFKVMHNSSFLKLMPWGSSISQIIMGFPHKAASPGIRHLWNNPTYIRKWTLWT